MKSLARKISQTFVKDSNGITRGTRELKKKKSIRDMMVDSFKNPFGYLKTDTMNNSMISNNKNINNIRYSTFTNNEYESVFNNPIDTSSYTKSDPAKLIYVPKNLETEDINNMETEEEVKSNENNINDSNTVNSKDFNNIPIQAVVNDYYDNKNDTVVSNSDINNNIDKIEEVDEGSSSEATVCSDDLDSSNCNELKPHKNDHGYSSYFSWRFIKSKISFSKSEVSNFCNDHKYTTYERYENYNSDNETADISEDETAIELQVINTNQNQMNEKYLVPEPDLNENHEFSI